MGKQIGGDAGMFRNIHGQHNDIADMVGSVTTSEADLAANSKSGSPVRSKDVLVVRLRVLKLAGRSHQGKRRGAHHGPRRQEVG
jgi:hypothetical protein